MNAVESNIVSYTQTDVTARTAAQSGDRIEWIRLSLTVLPLATPVSDAKVLTGRQKPLTEIAFVFAEIRTRDGHAGIGFGYSKRAGGPGIYAHAKELAPHLLGEDPNDISRLFTRLQWAGASMGRSGMTTQAIAPFDIALWDLKARRAGLPLASSLSAGSYLCNQALFLLLRRLPAEVDVGFLHVVPEATCALEVQRAVVAQVLSGALTRRAARLGPPTV